MTAPTSVINFTFGWNNFEGQIPQQGWRQFTQMRQLRLNDNNLEGPIPDELPNSSDLQYLYFNNNNFSGEVSTNHGKYADSGTYPEFQYMDISGNDFSSLDYQDLLDILGSGKLKARNQEE
jgi:Leucine-rich repeat (LRR) protein